MTLEPYIERGLDSLENFLGEFSVDSKIILDRRETIYDTLTRNSSDVTSGDFKSMTPKDLELLFHEYDRVFFNGLISMVMDYVAHAPVCFRLSHRMTSNGGKIIYKRIRSSFGKDPYIFEIVIAIDILYQQFQSGHGTVIVNGVLCRDRLYALLSVLEHEIIHLLEISLWGKSSCKKSRFHKMAVSIFGHTEFVHRMVTLKERAAKEHGIKIGSEVTFRHRGQEYEGIVNRITKRVTVLVNDVQGKLYNDGNRYQKFLLPLTELI